MSYSKQAASPYKSGESAAAREAREARIVRYATNQLSGSHAAVRNKNFSCKTTNTLMYQRVKQKIESMSDMIEEAFGSHGYNTLIFIVFKDPQHISIFGSKADQIKLFDRFNNCFEYFNKSVKYPDVESKRVYYKKYGRYFELVNKKKRNREEADEDKEKDEAEGITSDEALLATVEDVEKSDEYKNYEQ